MLIFRLFELFQLSPVRLLAGLLVYQGGTGLAAAARSKGAVSPANALYLVGFGLRQRSQARLAVFRPGCAPQFFARAVGLRTSAAIMEG